MAWMSIDPVSRNGKNWRVVLCLLGALGLASCSPHTTLLEKPAPLPVDAQSLIHPPWEALVKAGPGAENDVDLETLNGPQAAAPAPGQPVAADAAAPTPDEKPAAAPSPPKPGAVAIKAVAVLVVTGASPQGDKELTAAMRQVLKKAGWPVLVAPRKDALNIQGKVVLDAPNGPNQTIHIIWQVSAPSGKALGEVAQNNAVPAHSLDGNWGQTAGYAAEAAADGIFKLIGQYR
jgi:hypothetical protein